MRQTRPRPIKVFVTTKSGSRSYLVENTGVLEAVLPFIRRFRGCGYFKKITSNNENKIICIMKNIKTNDSVMISSYRLYWPNSAK